MQTKNQVTDYKTIFTSHFTFNKSTPMKAVWNNQVIAESNDTIVVENNHYFPKESVKSEYLRESNTHTTCPWKGVASYYSIDVDGQQNRDAA